MSEPVKPESELSTELDPKTPEQLAEKDLEKVNGGEFDRLFEGDGGSGGNGGLFGGRGGNGGAG